MRDGDLYMNRSLGRGMNPSWSCSMTQLFTDYFSIFVFREPGTNAMDNEHMGEAVEKGCAAFGGGSYGSKLVTLKTTQLGGVRRGANILDRHLDFNPPLPLVEQENCLSIYPSTMTISQTAVFRLT